MYPKPPEESNQRAGSIPIITAFRGRIRRQTNSTSSQRTTDFRLRSNHAATAVTGPGWATSLNRTGFAGWAKIG